MVFLELNFSKANSWLTLFQRTGTQLKNSTCYWKEILVKKETRTELGKLSALRWRWPTHFLKLKEE